MQLHIHIKLNDPIVLPINYNHILQGVIYNAVADDYPYYAELLHTGYGEYGYKAFTFGSLLGRYEILDESDNAAGLADYYDRKWIRFRGKSIEWQIRSIDPVLMTVLKLNIERKGMSLLGYEFDHKDIAVAVREKKLNKSKVLVEQKTPIVAYTAEPDGKTYYYTPEEYGFYELTRMNAVKRYKAVTGIQSENLIFKPVSIRRSDKVIKKYNGIIIEGWKGKYEMSGDPELIDFLYQTGIGSKNSQGFGMFDVISQG